MDATSHKRHSRRLGPHIPRELRVYMCEGHKLPDTPTPQQLHHACTVGRRIGNRKRAPRVKCASYISEKRWTTKEAWIEFLSIINEEQ